MTGGSGTRPAVGGGALAACVVVACNAISGLDGDYELAGGPTSLEDGAVDSSGGSSGQVDGAPDADASTGDDSGAGDWCPANAVFCENWDDHTTSWSREELVGGTYDVAPGEGVGGSAALHAHANTTASSRKIVRWKTIGDSFPDGKRYTLTFRFRIASAGLDYAVIGAIQANNTQENRTEYGLAAYKSCGRSGPSPCLDESNPPPEGVHPFVDHMGYQLAQWHRAEITVVRNGSSYLGTITVDGHAVDSNGATYFGTPQEPSLVEVGVGLFFTGNELGTADFYIDEIAAF